MDPKVWMYLIYLLVSIGLTTWVATTLSRNGLVFLVDVFADEKLARAINQLLVMGFYLLNLGYIVFAMATRRTVADASQAMEILAGKIGLVLLVLGIVHLANLFFLGRYRRNRLHPQSPPAARPPIHATLPAFPPGALVPHYAAPQRGWVTQDTGYHPYAAAPPHPASPPAASPPAAAHPAGARPDSSEEPRAPRPE